MTDMHTALAKTRPATSQPIGIPAARLIERTLSDAVLGFLALLSFFFMLAPAMFPLSADGVRTVLALEYAIVGLFAIEYGAGWVLSTDRSRFVLGRWRILDLLIIVAALVSLLPFGPAVLRSSPVLRLLRVGRLALLGTRSGFGLKSRLPLSSDHPPGPPPALEVMRLAASGSEFETIPWEAGLQRIASTEPDWLFVNGVTEDRLGPIAASLRVPEKALQGLFQSTVPRSDRLERFTTLFVRYPLATRPGSRLRRTPVLLVGTTDNVVVLSREQTELARRVERRLDSLDSTTPRMVRAMVALVSEILRAYGDVVEQLEGSLLDVEAKQATLTDTLFLAKTFDLRADILRVRSSLKHLRSVARDLSRGQLSVATTTVDDWAPFRVLADDAGDLYGGIEDVRDSLQALVDLRLNVFVPDEPRHAVAGVADGVGLDPSHRGRTAWHESSGYPLAGDPGSGRVRGGRRYGVEPLPVRGQGLAPLSSPPGSHG